MSRKYSLTEEQIQRAQQSYRRRMELRKLIKATNDRTAIAALRQEERSIPTMADLAEEFDVDDNTVWKGVHRDDHTRRGEPGSPP